jgi:hypothetical protein
MHEKVLPQVGRPPVQVVGNRHGKEHQQRDEHIAGHDAHDALLVEGAHVRHGLAQEHRPGMGQEEQEAGEQDRAVHRHIARADEEVQRVRPHMGRPPGLLPDMIPADDKHQQHPQTVEFWNVPGGGTVWLHMGLLRIDLMYIQYSILQRCCHGKNAARFLKKVSKPAGISLCITKQNMT